MKKMRRVMGPVFTASIVSCGPVFAEPAVESFMHIYASTCMKYLSNLNELRKKLHGAPDLPSAEATRSLQGAAGRAWPVPDPHGVFVIALPSGKNTCSVSARKVDGRAAEAVFLRIVERAPAPMVSHRIAAEHGGDSRSVGAQRSVAYEWRIPKTHRKLVYALTTSPDPADEPQAMATATMVR